MIDLILQLWPVISGLSFAISAVCLYLIRYHFRVVKIEFRVSALEKGQASGESRVDALEASIGARVDTLERSIEKRLDRMQASLHEISTTLWKLQGWIEGNKEKEKL